MPTSSLYRHALAFLLAASSAFALGQSSPSSTYEPSVGQDGKDVVWVPTPQIVVDTKLDMAKVTPGDYVMDLGSGDGRTVITAAKRGARAVGIEYNPDMVELSKRKMPGGKLTLKQEFQMLSGTLRIDGKVLPVTGKFRGEEITFAAGRREYRGRLNGKRLELR